MQQGEPGGRPDRRPGSSDIEERGRDTQVGAGLLQLPGQASQPYAVHFRAGKHRDRIRTEGAYRGRDVIEASVHRYPGDLVAPDGCATQAPTTVSP